MFERGKSRKDSGRCQQWGLWSPHEWDNVGQKIWRLGFYWITMENDCHQYVKSATSVRFMQTSIHVPPALLHNLTSPWPFCTWGIDIIGKVTPKASNGHEYILVAISFFTKWVEAASYRTLTSAKVAKFIKDKKSADMEYRTS